MILDAWFWTGTVIGVLSLLGTAWVAHAVLGVDRRLRVTPPGP